MAVDWNAPEIIAKIEKGARRGIVIAIGLVEARAVYLITQTAKTGRKYRRRGVTHQASAPFQPFASDTGDTLKRRDISFADKGLRGILTFRSKNAARMEFGTKLMWPRPFARRALSETATQAQDAIIGEVVAELKK